MANGTDMNFTQKVIFARAIFTTENTDIFTNRPSKSFSSRRRNAIHLEDYHRMFFPSICDKDFSKKLMMNEADERITGILVLEAFLKRTVCDFKAIPFGMMVIRANKEKRDDILTSCSFSSEDIEKGFIRFFWFSFKDICELNGQVMQADETYHTWHGLWAHCSKKIKMKGTKDNYCPLDSNSFHHSYWETQNIFNSWTQQVGMQDCHEEEGSPVENRQLHTLEKMWMYFNVSLRWRRSRSASPLIRLEILNKMTVCSKKYKIPKSLLPDIDIYSTGKSLHRYHGQMAVLMAHMPSLACALEESYLEWHMTLEKAKKLVNDNLTSAMHAIRLKFRAFPVYTSCQLKTFTEDSISSIPMSKFDIQGLQKWAEERADHLTNVCMTDKAVYGSIYGKAFPQYEGGEKSCFKLYGNFNTFIATLGSTSALAKKLVYKYERLGCLSSPCVQPLPKYGIPPGRDASWIFNDPILSHTSARLQESSDFFTPIWAIPSGDGMDYRRIVPHMAGKRPNDPDMLGSVEDLITRYMYANNSAGAGKTNEFLQSGLHWSSFVADIDLKLLEGKAPPAVEQVAHDSVELLNEIFEKIFGGLKIRRHMVFASVPNGKQNDKLGLHHHAVLPLGLVFTSNACKEIAQILEDARHAYPETLGLTINEDSPVYDQAIYPLCNIDGHKGHCLRGPFQVKQDDTKKLECVLDTEDRAITVSDILIHGPQYDRLGQRIIYGRVVKRIGGIELLSDIPFFQRYEEGVMSKNIRSAASYTVAGLIEEINQKSFLFDGHNGDTEKLLNIVNSLWNECEGKQKFKNHLVFSRGTCNARFTDNMVDSALSTHFVHDRTKNTISLSIKGNHKAIFPFCPMKPHRSDKKQPVRISVWYSSKGIKMFLFISGCFKSSCKSLGDRFLPSVTLSMPDIFIAPYLKRQVKDFVQHQMVGPRIRVTKIEEERDGEGKNCPSTDGIALHATEIRHYHKGINYYIPEDKELSSYTRRLFVFLEERILAVELCSNLYVVGTPGRCFVSKQPRLLLSYLSSKESSFQEARLLKKLSNIFIPAK